MRSIITITAAIAVAVACPAMAQHTEVKHLSGTDAENTVQWQFLCSDGMDSGQWGTIAVPSCWEQQGYGQYTYGRYYKTPGLKASTESGHYRHEFSVPPSWQGKRVQIVFEGAMTDATVSINGTVTGQGPTGLVYPEFKGYHANVYWAQVESATAPITFYSETDGLYLRMFTPEEPTAATERTMQAFPPGDISFLFEIPGMRSYKPIEQLGPEAQPSSIRINKGDDGLRMKLWMEFK